MKGNIFKQMGHPAHIRRTSEGAYEYQSVAEHCRNTARYASEALNVVGLGAISYLAGLIHDLGKTKEQFKDHIEKAVLAGERTGKTVNHTFSGVRYMLETYHSGKDPLACVASEVIAYAVGAHHGLFDIATREENGFRHRMEKQGISHSEAVRNFLSECASREELDGLFQRAVEEMEPLSERLEALEAEDIERYPGELEFFGGMTARLILSAVIEGDRRDTAEFMSFLKERKKIEPSEIETLWREALSHVEKELAGLGGESRIDRARREISDRCRKMAEQREGIYRLSVPTGAGKTLSSLRFALAHALRHGKRRIFFISPLISIIDQNAEVIREYVHNDRAILVHHSNLVQESSETGAQERRELLMEDWSAPIIITTLVQFLDTLFLGRTSSVRRMQALCDSVVVIDEVQTVPIKLLTMFNLAVRFLSEICRCTFVLCTATQPYLEGADHPIVMDLDEKLREIIPYRPEMWSVFDRTRIVDAGAVRLQELPEFVRGKFAGVPSGLVVCNTKKEAQELFSALRGDGGVRCFHLSAAMCMAHRRKVLEEMRTAMMRCDGKGERVICVSTQVIEAGVDISFACVVRVMAGMDSIVQAAGRCNRNGESEARAPVYVVRLEDESLAQLREIRDAKTATISLFADYRRDPSRYGDDPASKMAIERYYSTLYRSKGASYQDDPIGDGETVYSLLSQNLSNYTEEDAGYFLRQGFATAGKEFRVFDEDTMDVIVPYGKGKEIIASLQGAGMEYDLIETRRLLDMAKPYAVSLYRGQRMNMVKKGMVYPIGGGEVCALVDWCYDPDTGLVPSGEKMDYLEVG